MPIIKTIIILIIYSFCCINIYNHQNLKKEKIFIETPLINIKKQEIEEPIGNIYINKININKPLYNINSTQNNIE